MLSVQHDRKGKSFVNVCLGLLFVLGYFAASAVAEAAPLNWNVATTVPLTSPSVDFIVVAGSVADTFTVNATSVVTTLSASTGGSFTLTSASRDLVIATSSAGGTVTTSCTSGVASTTISQGTGSTVYTIAPSASQCSSSSGSSTSSSPGIVVGVGAGGAFSQFTSVNITAPAQSATVRGQITVTASSPGSQEIVSVQLGVDGAPWGSKITTGAPYMFSLDTKALVDGVHTITVYASNRFGDTARATPVTIVVANNIPVPESEGAAPSLKKPPSSLPVSGGIFNKHLAIGSRGEDVSALQKLLLQEDVYPEGTISGYFGTLTREAVRRFQEKYGLAGPADPGYGTVGPMTRAKLNTLSSSYVQGPPPLSNKFPRLTEPLYFTKEGTQVSVLQRMLREDASVYPEGRITGYYGTLTLRAVQRFQEKYGIVSGGDALTTGYGLVGQKTRAKLNELYGE